MSRMISVDAVRTDWLTTSVHSHASIHNNVPADGAQIIVLLMILKLIRSINIVWQIDSSIFRDEKDIRQLLIFRCR